MTARSPLRTFVMAAAFAWLGGAAACSTPHVIGREGGGGSPGAAGGPGAAGSLGATGTGGAGGSAGSGPLGGGPAGAGGGGAGGGAPSGKTCTPIGSSETACGDGKDDDCDGYPDCLDPDCEGRTCGAATGFACMAGACLQPGAGGLPSLPKIDNVRVTMREDTAVIDFEPVAGALDYRVYLMPAAADILTGATGELSVRNAVYRCAGDRPVVRREDDAAGHVELSLANQIAGYTRSGTDAVLGYVYLTPGAGRQPVYRLSNADLVGGFAWEYLAPPRADYDGADYAVGAAARDSLVAQGWRDDGVAFYVPDGATVPVYRREYKPNTEGYRVAVFYAQGPEQTARDRDAASTVASTAERFRVLPGPVAAQGTTDGTVPLYRVFYSWANGHDVLAPGEARYQLALHQGNQPISSLVWPGLAAGTTTLVIEALDAGCPFPGGYIGASHAASSSLGGIANAPTLTVDEARLPSGEVYVNGQHETTNRPRPIARAYVPVTALPAQKMDWQQTFDVGGPWEPFSLIVDDNIGTKVYRNSSLSAEFLDCYMCNHSFGPVLGQLAFGSTAPVYLVARGVDARVAPDHYLHVRMDTDIPSTFRRYPQLWITTTPVVEPSQVAHTYDVPVAARLGPWPFQMLPPGDQYTLVVQPFGFTHELQIEFCDQRGWGVSQQCPRANLYGYHAGDYMETWVERWRPVPVLGELAGSDRLVRFDVYASTKRVYVFVDGRPGGCAVLPDGRMPAGPVTVVFGSAAYHIDIDESVVPETAAHHYWHRSSLTHVDRRMDNLGIELSAPLPAWDETVLPCGTRWYGGSK